MPRVVHVTAPSRLHFGLWSLAGEQGRQFGGVGAMIDEPALELLLTEAAQFQVQGSGWERTLAYAQRWAKFHSHELPGCCIGILRVIPQHAGLGSGTQQGLAVAAALNAFCDLPGQSPQELALSVDRGLRSAVGTYGFAFGGMIVEQGKLEGEPISPLDCRIDLPEQWRFVLVRPKEISGLAGEDEAAAFDALPEVPRSLTDQLIAIVHDQLVPAAALADFDRFATSLYEYGSRSGELFAARQGGPFNGPAITALVEQILLLGYSGVGQSSWGPTIFVATPSIDAAKRLVNSLRSCDRQRPLDLVIAAPNNCGAKIIASHPAELAGSV